MDACQYLGSSYFSRKITDLGNDVVGSGGVLLRDIMHLSFSGALLGAADFLHLQKLLDTFYNKKI